jgi:hypothetical protein
MMSEGSPEIQDVERSENSTNISEPSHRQRGGDGKMLIVRLLDIRCFLTYSKNTNVGGSLPYSDYNCELDPFRSG